MMSDVYALQFISNILSTCTVEASNQCPKGRRPHSWCAPMPCIIFSTYSKNSKADKVVCYLIFDLNTATAGLVTPFSVTIKDSFDNWQPDPTISQSGISVKMSDKFGRSPYVSQV